MRGCFFVALNFNLPVSLLRCYNIKIRFYINNMGFFESLGPFIGVRQDKTPKERFNPNQKSNTTKLKEGAWKLKRPDRQKFLGMLKEEGMWHKTVSNRQLKKTMERRHDPKLYRERIKNQLLTKQLAPTVDEKAIARNVRLTTFDRIREDAKFGKDRPAQQERTGLSNKPGQGEVLATAKRPGTVRTANQDERIINSDIHLPV